jgi:hypothetical protein
MTHTLSSFADTVAANATSRIMYDIGCPPLMIRPVNAYVPMTPDAVKRVHSEFFAHIQRSPDEIFAKAVMSCGMELQEFAVCHVRNSHKQRRTRGDGGTLDAAVTDDDDDDQMEM